MACRGCATRATRCSFISGRGLGRRPWTSDELLEAFDRTLPYGRHGLLLGGGGGYARALYSVGDVGGQPNFWAGEVAWYV